MLDSDPEVVRKRAMENPEVQAILADPAMQMILQQMQKDPNALKEWVLVLFPWRLSYQSIFWQVFEGQILVNFSSDSP